MTDSLAETPQAPPADTFASDELTALRAELERTKRALQSETSSRQSAESARAQAEQRGMSEAEKRLVAEENASKSAIESMDREADGIEADIGRLADEPGHGAEIAKLNRKLAQIEAKRQSEDQRQAWLADQRQKAKAQTEAPSDTGRKLRNGAPLSQFSPKDQAWFEAHPKCFTDEGYLKRVIAAAVYARDVEQLSPSGQDYYDYIEQVVDGASAQAAPAPAIAHTEDLGEELVPAVERPQSRAAGPGSMTRAMAAVAPPSRAAATAAGSPGNRRLPLLTADQKEAADGLFAHIPVADRYIHYADRKAMMEKLRPGAFGGN